MNCPSCGDLKEEIKRLKNKLTEVENNLSAADRQIEVANECGATWKSRYDQSQKELAKALDVIS